MATELHPVRPFHAEGLLEFLRPRCVPGVEAVDGRVYRRAWGDGVLELDLRDGVVLARAAGDAADVAGRIADVAADAPRIDDHLRGVEPLARLVRAAPGLRVPGGADPAELAIRAVLGQQVSVEAARTLAARLSAAHGRPLARPGGGVERAFVAPEALARLEPDALPMPRARGRALVGLARALADGMPVTREGLLRLPGIGPWTADYVALRALGDRDVLLASDLGVRRALQALGVEDAAGFARACSPYGSYATVHLWRALGARKASP